jgi:hypothetical protein
MPAGCGSPRRARRLGGWPALVAERRVGDHPTRPARMEGAPATDRRGNGRPRELLEADGRCSFFRRPLDTCPDGGRCRGPASAADAGRPNCTGGHPQTAVSAAATGRPDGTATWPPCRRHRAGCAASGQHQPSASRHRGHRGLRRRPRWHCRKWRCWTASGRCPLPLGGCPAGQPGGSGRRCSGPARVHRPAATPSGETAATTGR